MVVENLAASWRLPWGPRVRVGGEADQIDGPFCSRWSAIRNGWQHLGCQPGWIGPPTTTRHWSGESRG